MKTNTRKNYKEVDKKTGELAVLTKMRHSNKKWWHAWEFIDPKNIQGTYRYPARISDLAKNKPELIETMVDSECKRMSLYRLIK